jgi:hypothetical protein
MEKQQISLQQAYEKIRAHLIAQGRPASARMPYSVNSACFYRHREGDVVLKCAVGCLIDDDIYDMDLEDNSVGADVVTEALKQSGLSLTDRGVAFLSDAQMAHDGWDRNDLPWVLKRLDDAADHYGLVSIGLDHQGETP